MSAKDELLALSEENQREPDSENEDEDEAAPLIVADSPPAPPTDSRFYQPTPSSFKRGALIVFVIVLFWLAIYLRRGSWIKDKPEVVYANRYSKEFKFRPAASPIITERLKDGRLRVRGAQVTDPEPLKQTQPTPAKRSGLKKRKSKKKANGRSK